jgi:ribosomal protein S18 acetylase RimI-like enzyme
MIAYRAARPDEAGALAELARDTFVETFGSLYSAEDLDAFLSAYKTPVWMARALADADKRIHVAVEDDRLIGYCIVAFTSSLDYDLAGKKVVELSQLYLPNAYQGKGIAKALMDWALEQARDADEMILSVWSGNERAQRFYQKYGFAWIADTVFMVGAHRDEEFLYRKQMRSA